MKSKDKKQSASAGAVKSEHCFSKDPANNHQPKNFIGKLSKRGATEAPQTFDKDSICPYCGKGFKSKMAVCGHLKSCVEKKLSSSDKKCKLGEGPPIKVMTDEGEVEITDCMVKIDDSMCFPVRKPGGQIIQGVPCKTCKKVFTSERQRGVHYRQHPECGGYTLQCDHCKCPFKNEKGLKQHKDRSDCGNVPNVQESNPVTGISEDCNHLQLTDQDSHHHVSYRYSLDDEKECLEKVARKEPINWPPMRPSHDYLWKELDKAVLNQLDWNGEVNEKYFRLTTILYEEAKSKFGCKERTGKKITQPTRRERKLVVLRNQIKDLTKKINKCQDVEERDGLLLVRDDLKEQKREARRKETSRKNRWKRNKARHKFYKDPYGACKSVLEEKSNKSLNVEKEVMDRYVQEVAEDNMRDIDLGELEGLPEAPLPIVDFNTKKFYFTEFEAVIRKTRNGSKPGPNQIPYKVYKKCHGLRRFLFSIIQSLHPVKTGIKVPLKFRISDGIFIPKVADPDEKNINDYRQIALLNVEGKLFWSLVGRRLYKYLVEDNSYIKTSNQKGSIRGMAGCWEHTSMVWAAIKDARKNRTSLALLWLDLANAYGSVPHQLIKVALKRYHVPEVWADALLAYYDGLWGRSSSSGVNSDWVRYEKGIFAGCPASVILFLMAFNLIIEYVELGNIEQYCLQGRKIEVTRGFMDDISLMTVSTPKAALALARVNTALKWARMNLKPSKSRSLVIKRGEVIKVEPFSVDGDIIPGLHNKPLRTLGRFFDWFISDKYSITKLQDKFTDSLVKLDKSLLTGFMKAWALTHVVVCQVQWDFMIYEISITIIESLERKQNVYLRKWLGVAKCLTDVALYSKSVPCPLPLKSLVSVFKTTKVGSFLQLLYSKDDQVSNTSLCHKTGPKWDIRTALKSAESRVHMEKVVGNTRGGESILSEGSSRFAGLGHGKFQSNSPQPGTKEHRHHIADMVRADIEESRYVKAVELALQGTWTAWRDYIQRNISWKGILGTKGSLLRFCLGATYDTLSTPSNLERWGLISKATCALCGQEGCCIRHILSGCPKALGQGRYEWRHNTILRTIAHGIQSFIQNNKVVSQGIKKIHFVPESNTTKCKKTRKPDLGILHRAADFICDVDLDKRLKYPNHIAVSDLRPDIVVYSNSLKLVLHIELTAPCEERFKESNAKKDFSYGINSKLELKCRDNGWKVLCFPVEVGARGYAAKSLQYCLRKLGLGRNRSKSISKEAADASLRCSFWIWLLKDSVEWKLSRGFKSKNESSSTNPSVDKVTISKDPLSKPKSVINVSIDNMTPSATPDLPILRQRINRPSGLINIGQSCYMNAALQCAFVIFDSENLGNCESVKGIAEAWSNGRVPKSAIQKFKKEFVKDKDCKQFDNFLQHDSQEFFNAFVNFIVKSGASNKLTGKLSQLQYSTSAKKH